MSREEERQHPLTRERLVEAALGLIGDEGLDGLSMRALADALVVKAASLYWHVRDRRELVELLAESILDSVRPLQRRSGWRQGALDAAAALGQAVAAQKDADRILLGVPEALERSDVFAELKRQLQTGGLQPAEAGAVALMVMVHVITARPAAGGPPPVEVGSTASIAVDTGSRGVVLRAGANDMETLFRIGPDRTAAAPAVVRGETVIVRRLRGVGLGEIELNPRHPWRFKIQAPTWNTVLDVGGLDVREIKLDSGATKVECFLPRPRGVVPIIVSGGVVGVSLHRPPGVAVTADISTGAVTLKLDGHSIRAAVQDLRWESDGAATAVDRYELRISGGAFQVTLDSAQTDTAPPPVITTTPAPAGEPASALDILLDGVESRVRSRAHGQDSR